MIYMLKVNIWLRQSCLVRGLFILLSLPGRKRKQMDALRGLMQASSAAAVATVRDFCE